MKKLLIIGKMNDVMKNLAEYMQKYFRVQLCMENTQHASAIMKVVEPDLVIILLVGVYEIDMNIFDALAKDFSGVPVITIGTQREYDSFSAHLKGVNCENIIRPVNNTDILQAVCRKLGMSEDGMLSDRDKDKRKHILLVDDDPASLRSIKSMLDDKYRISLANSGTKAMVSIGKDRPDLILLDYEMPVCDGRQTLIMIREDDDLKDIPVIFLTGVNDRKNIEAVLMLKPAGYILKPPVPERLKSSIEKALSENN